MVGKVVYRVISLLRDRLDDSLLKLLLNRSVVLPQYLQLMPQSFEQSLQLLHTELIVVCQGLTKLFPGKWHLVTTILRGYGGSKLIVEWRLLLRNPQRLKLPKGTELLT